VVISDDDVSAVELGLTWDGAAAKLYVQDPSKSSNNAFNGTLRLTADSSLVLQVSVAFNFISMALQRVEVSANTRTEVGWLLHELPLNRASWGKVGWIANSRNTGRTMCLTNVMLRNSSGKC
jgi:hypothetical protein